MVDKNRNNAKDRHLVKRDGTGLYWFMGFGTWKFIQILPKFIFENCRVRLIYFSYFRWIIFPIKFPTEIKNKNIVIVKEINGGSLIWSMGNNLSDREQTQKCIQDRIYALFCFLVSYLPLTLATKLSDNGEI